MLFQRETQSQKARRMVSDKWPAKVDKSKYKEISKSHMLEGAGVWGSGGWSWQNSGLVLQPTC